MSLLDNLPPELICRILSFLLLQDLRALRITSRQWDRFFCSNETYIYHHAAIQHNFVPSVSTSISDLLRVKETYLRGIGTWKALCQSRFTLERNWAFPGHRPLKLIAGDHPDVHRIKVDESVGIVMTSHADGGLVVRDMETNEVLWGLPRTYVRNYAHCEYGNGFLIFDRLGQAKEVWRLASEYDHSPLPADEFQQEISFTINQYIPLSKGNFKPWALLTTPQPGRAFRFVYPILLVASFTKAFLYNVESGQLVQTVEDIQSFVDGTPLGDINYVELSPLHVLICGTMQLRFFERGSGRLVHWITSETASTVSVHVAVDECESMGTETRSNATVVPVPHHPLHQPASSPDAQFMAVHVSPDGTTVVALMSDSRLLVIKDIKRMIKGEVNFKESALIIHLSCPEHSTATADSSAIYLAFEFGRVGVITTFGVFVITLDTTLHGLEDPWTKAHRGSGAPSGSENPSPDLRICRLSPFEDKEYLERVTCLQMTRSRVFFTWNPSIISPQSLRAGLHEQPSSSQQHSLPQDVVTVEGAPDFDPPGPVVGVDQDDEEAPFIPHDDRNNEDDDDGDGDNDEDDDGNEDDDDDDDMEQFLINVAALQHTWEDDDLSCEFKFILAKVDHL